LALRADWVWSSATLDCSSLVLSLFASLTPPPLRGGGSSLAVAFF